MHLNLNAFLARRPLRIGPPLYPPRLSFPSGPPHPPSGLPFPPLTRPFLSIIRLTFLNPLNHFSQPLLPLLLSSQHFSTYLLPIPSSLCPTPTSLPHVLPRFYLPSTICIPSPLPSQYLLSHLISQFKSGYSSSSTFPHPFFR